MKPYTHLAASLPSLLPNPKHTHTHKHENQKIFPAAAAVEKEDIGEIEKRTSQMGIKCNGRSEVKRGLFEKTERRKSLLTALHECQCSKPTVNKFLSIYS